MLAQTETAPGGFAMTRPVVESNDDARSAARLEERAAIDACLKGDVSAFDALVIRHQKTIQRVCYRFTGNSEDAADLTQEVFVKAYRSLSKFRGTSAFSTWLYRIAVNSCLSFKASPRNRTENWDEDHDIAKDEEREPEGAQARIHEVEEDDDTADGDQQRGGRQHGDRPEQLSAERRHGALYERRGEYGVGGHLLCGTREQRTPLHAQRKSKAGRACRPTRFDRKVLLVPYLQAGSPSPAVVTSVLLVFTAI